MTSGTHALILAQSAFEAVCKERDEALAKLSTVRRWVEKNLSGGFVDSLTHLQNLESVADDWYGRLVETIRERDEARDQLEAMREAIKEAHALLKAMEAVVGAAKCIRHWHDAGTDGMIVSRWHVFKLWEALVALRENDQAQAALAKLQPFFAHE